MPEQYYEKQHFVEDTNLYFEQFGLPRMAGGASWASADLRHRDQSITDLCERLQAMQEFHQHKHAPARRDGPDQAGGVARAPSGLLPIRQEVG